MPELGAFRVGETCLVEALFGREIARPELTGRMSRADKMRVS